jgi:phospholipid/cholesterol/gamma-HCH transport system substrate-binding protein
MLQLAMTRQLKVGIFVIFGLVLTMVAIFLIGDTRGLWQAKTSYRTAFDDVAGLKPGAPIRMGGVDIGAVTGLGHGSNANDARAFVTMNINRKEAPRIKTDTVARVVNKGLLGDKMIELSVGSATSPSLDPSSLIPSEEPSDVLAAANRVAAETERAIQKLEPLAQQLGDPKFAADIRGSAADIHSLLDAIVHGDGMMHRLFYDRGEADQLDQLLGRLNSVSARVDSQLADLQDVTTHLREGPGIAHALVYDGEISKSAAGTMQELHEDLRAIREGNGIAHALLFGDDSSQHMMTNINAMSDDLRAIVAGIRQGKGTIGALLVDPTVYEDIKSAVGNVERNQVLRALVRYSIKADEQNAHPPKVDGHP